MGAHIDFVVAKGRDGTRAACGQVGAGGLVGGAAVIAEDDEDIRYPEATGRIEVDVVEFVAVAQIGNVGSADPMPLVSLSSA